MKRLNLIAVASLLAAMDLSAAAASGHVSITADQVAAAISASAMAVSPEQVTLLTEVVSKTNAPALKVQSIEPWGSHRIKVRIACADQEECLPFYVAVHFAEDNGAKPVTRISSETSSLNSPAGQSPQTDVVRAGSRAILLIDNGHVHVRLNVVCLENGAAGQRIRVECKDPKQTFIAKVISGGVMRGSL
jgi:hypothetical protein